MVAVVRSPKSFSQKVLVERCMATSTEMALLLSQLSGLPETTVANVVRKLGEAGFLPRGGRGKSLSRLTASECANLLVGVMYVTSGVEGSAARVAASVKVAMSLALTEAGSDMTVASNGPQQAISERFVDAVGALLGELAKESDADEAVLCIAAGLTHGRTGLWGWLEISPDFTDENPYSTVKVGQAWRLVFSNGSAASGDGIIREVRVDRASLKALAIALATDGTC
jgi:hypothetical protein